VPGVKFSITCTEQHSKTAFFGLKCLQHKLTGNDFSPKWQVPSGKGGTVDVPLGVTKLLQVFGLH